MKRFHDWLIDEESERRGVLTSMAFVMIGTLLAWLASIPLMFGVLAGVAVFVALVDRLTRYEIDSSRVLLIDPPIGGRSVWMLDVDGPLVFDSAEGEFTIVPVGERLDATIEPWGPGGSAGRIG